MSGLPDVVYYRFRYRGKPLGEGKSPRKLQATALAIIEKSRTLIGVSGSIDTDSRKERNTHWRKELKIFDKPEVEDKVRRSFSPDWSRGKVHAGHFPSNTHAKM
jgi:hypothetical protein